MGAPTRRWPVGNGELEDYTASRANASLDGLGHLVITVRRSPTKGDPYPYTSARLVSKATVGPYFRAVARIKMPTEVGLWPSFWLLGGTIAQPSWPHKGEIDVAEVIGRYPTTTYATPHGYSYDPHTQPFPHVWHAPTPYNTGIDLSAGFHTYGVDVRPDEIVWTFDGTAIKTFTKAQLPPGALWSFGNPMHAILDVAVGGFFAGPPNASTALPAQMVIDYIRINALEPKGQTPD